MLSPSTIRHIISVSEIVVAFDVWVRDQVRLPFHSHQNYPHVSTDSLTGACGHAQLGLSLLLL